MKNDYLDQAFGWGRVALVTGAARGLGTPSPGAGPGRAKVVVNDLSAQACDAACERLKAAGIQARAPFDVADGEAVGRAARAGGGRMGARRAGQQRWQPEPQARGRDDGRMAGAAERARQRRFNCARGAAGHGPARLRPHRADVVRGRAGHHANIAAYATARAPSPPSRGRWPWNTAAAASPATRWRQASCAPTSRRGCRTIRSSSPSCPRRCRPDAGPSRTISRRRWCTWLAGRGLVNGQVLAIDGGLLARM